MHRFRVQGLGSRARVHHGGLRDCTTGNIIFRSGFCCPIYLLFVGSTQSAWSVPGFVFGRTRCHELACMPEYGRYACELLYFEFVNLSSTQDHIMLVQLQNELQSKLLVSPFITPVVVP